MNHQIMRFNFFRLPLEFVVGQFPYFFLRASSLPFLAEPFILADSLQKATKLQISGLGLAGSKLLC
jgi:hypothetical protein